MHGYAEAHCPYEGRIGKTAGRRGSTRAEHRKSALILALMSALAMDEA